MNPGQVVLIEHILRKYKLAWTRLSEPSMGYRNRSYPVQLADGRTANVILYKTEAGILTKIRAANTVSNYLANHGLPARRSLDHRIIALRPRGRVKYGAVYHYLPGRTIPWEAYTKDHIKLLGLAMSRLHIALQGLEIGNWATHNHVVDVHLAILHRMQLYFDQAAVQSALQAKLHLAVTKAHFTRFAKLLEACRHLPGQHILHMDFVRSNILFGDNHPELQIGKVAITGILDFEKTAYGHPAFDLARTLAFLLVDCKYKPEAKIRKYFLHSGYGRNTGHRFDPSYLHLKGQTINLLEPLIDLFLLHDLYKFLLHNPYEYLPQNEHFIRTRDLLLRRNLIQNTLQNA